MRHVRIKQFLPALLLMFIAGCGIWTDFTTYFNTYYNAKTLFDITEESILLQQKDVFAFREATLTPQQVKDLTSVIEKCSKILQFKSESSFFDAAVFMTGKAFYYQQEYAKAQRKFLELAGITDTKYALENKLWLAKTYLQLRSFEEGLKLIEEVKAEALAEDKDKMFVNSSIAKISFLIFREQYNEAVAECNSFLEKLDDDEVAALASYQLGKIYVLLNDNESALKAFAEVSKYSPTYEVEFESKLESALLLKELNMIDESEKALTELQYAGKFRNQVDRVMVELGKIYYSKNENEKAIGIFKEVDSTYKAKPSAGIASKMLGEIYERAIRDYDSSYKYYNKTVPSLAPSEIKLEAVNRSKNLSSYFALKRTETDLENDLKYINEPTEFLRDSIDYDIAYNQYMEERQKQTPTQQNLLPAAQQLIQSREQTQQQNTETQTTQNITTGRDSLSLVALIASGKAKKPLRPKISADSVAFLIIQNLYNLGNLFYSELDVPDSAAYYFQTGMERYPNKLYAINSMFALATLYETQDQKEKAEPLFKFIYENHPEHKLYTEAGIKIGMIKREEKKVVSSSDPAEPLYINAEEKYFSGEYQQAIEKFREIYLNYPGSEFTPKSIYFIGLIYEERKQYDSAAFFYGILSSKEYAGTPYGKAVVAKYTEYKSEKEKLEKAAEEELKAQLEKEAVLKNGEKINGVNEVQNNEISDDKPLIRSTNKDSVLTPIHDDVIQKVETDTVKVKTLMPD